MTVMLNKALTEVNNMTANKDNAKKMFGTNTSCSRTIGGRCVGNCRKTGTR